MTECYSDQLPFPSLAGKSTVVEFTVPQASSDSGWVLLREVDRELGVTRRLSRCLVDEREPAKIRHGLLSLAHIRSALCVRLQRPQPARR